MAGHPIQLQGDAAKDIRGVVDGGIGLREVEGEAVHFVDGNGVISSYLLQLIIDNFPRISK